MDPLRVIERENALIFKVSGDLTMDIVERLTTEVKSRLKSSVQDRIAVDLSEVPFMDSSGIGFLVATKNRTTSAGKSFHLLQPSSYVRRTLELVQLISYFGVADSEVELG